MIIGHIQAIDNSTTKAGKYYSMIEFTGPKYLNRGGGTQVCGPVLFSVSSDQGASGIELSDDSATALQNNADLRSDYGLSESTLLYRYQDNCTALSAMPQ